MVRQLPHIGTFAEVTRTTMVREAFKQICDIPTKLICFFLMIWMDYESSSNIPNQGMVAAHMGRTSSIPDPFGEAEVWALYECKT